MLTRTRLSEEQDERTLVEAARRDPSRFADLYEQNFNRVYAYIVRRVSDRHPAEDLTARDCLSSFAVLVLYCRSQNHLV